MNASPPVAFDPADRRFATLAEAETLGQPLSPDDVAFLRTHVPRDPGLQAEHALRWALPGWGEGPMAGEDDEAVIAAAVNGHLHGTRERERTGGRVVWLAAAAAGLAAAAAVVLAVVARPGETPAANELARVDAPALAKAAEDPAVPRSASALRSLSGTWIDEDGAPIVGAPAPDTVVVASAKACLGDDAGTRLCVEPGARVRAVAAADPTSSGPVVEWLGGRGELVMPATPAPQAVVLELRVAGVRVSGPGASVAVETTVEGRWSLTVREGQVSLQTPEGTRTLQAGDRWAPGDSASSSEVDVQEAGPSRAPTPDAASLLRQARAARASGSMADAAALYRRLLKAHPRSPSSGPAWVALGQVELARGRASAALDAFDRYLEQGGPLAEEAAYGRIEALGALGRRRDEQAAIDRFLAKYPGSSYAATLRRRP
jgi:Tetratricopeptide repeat